MSIPLEHFAMSWLGSATLIKSLFTIFYAKDSWNHFYDLARMKMSKENVSIPSESS